MVVKMMRWPPWPPLSSRKFDAKVIIHKLQGLNWVQDGEQDNDESGFCGDGVFEWNEEFNSVCNLSGNKDGVFLPWEIVFAVFIGFKQGPRNKALLVGTATLNLAEYASIAKEREAKIDVPLTVHNGTVEAAPSLHLSIKLMELITIQEPPRAVQRVIETAPPTSPSPSSSSLETLSPRRDELSVIKAGLRKVKSFQVTKKACHEENNYDRCRFRSEDAEDNYPFDTDSLDNDGNQRRAAKQAITNAEDESWIYYNHHKQDMGSLYVESSTASDHEQSLRQSSIRGILAWRKRKLRCGEEGGDDIDFDRRQLSSSDESSSGWETKEVISRDGHMKLQAQVFFASIDQRTLVAVIANWLQSNQYEVPIKSEFDSLIRVGSLEWRNLCEKEDYRERFPDKHFDLETILEAKIRPLSVVQKSLEEGDFDFLHGAMSFDSIWQEINHHGSDLSSNCDPFVYIVSWNDHFFVLKVEQDAYYIIDTLGEALRGIYNNRKLPKEIKESDEKLQATKQKTQMEEEIVCKGKESCKEYIKSFLAAIPIRGLQADIKKGLMHPHPFIIGFKLSSTTPN
ncbi:Origin recognition complex [Salix suchowensis]|nr:Origin recognition complex [Salix suchowensis]